VSEQAVPNGGVTSAAGLPCESKWGGLAVEALAAAAQVVERLDTDANDHSEARDPVDAAVYDVGAQLACAGQHWAQAIVCALQDIAAELRGRRIEREEMGG
jgi:hypothetical protein